MGPFAPLFEIANKLPSPWKQLLWGAIIIGFSGFLIFKTFRYIPQGQMAILLRNKKAVFRNGNPVYRNAGLRIVIPMVNNFELVSILDRVYDLRTVPIRYEMYTTINVTATVVFEMDDIYRHRYKVEDPVNRVTSECEALLQRCVQAIPHDQLGQALPEIEAAFRILIASASWEVGLRFKKLNLTFEPRDLMAIAGALASLGPNSKEVLGNVGALLTPNSTPPQ